MIYHLAWFGPQISCSVSVCLADSCNSTRGADSLSEYLIIKLEVSHARIVEICQFEMYLRFMFYYN